MANDCLAQIHACVLRVARLEPNGVPDPGANNLITSDALTVLTATPEYEAGDEFTVKNGCGDLCVNYRSRDTLKRLGIELTICNPDPQLHELLAGGTVLTSGAAVGYAAPIVGVDPTPNGVSIELWTHRITDDGALDATFPYAWWVFPRVYLQLGPKTHENGPLMSTFTGYGIENPNWYNGPTNNWPLTADSDRVFQWLPTNQIPAASCGYAVISVS